MTHETLKTIGDIAIVSATGTGAVSTWLKWVKEYDTVIGLFLTLFFGLIGIFFYYLNWKKQILADENKKTLNEHKEKMNSISVALSSHKKQTQKEFNNVNSGIQSILDKIT